jgi:hypothetical protein
MTNTVKHKGTKAEIHHLKRPVTIQTPHGPSKGFKGHFVLTVGDDQWPITPAILQARYEPDDEATRRWLEACLEWNRQNGIE